MSKVAQYRWIFLLFLLLTPNCLELLKAWQKLIKTGSKRTFQHEASLIVPDFTISVYGSSCNYLSFGLVLIHLLFLFISWHPIMSWGCRQIERESKGRKETTIHELPYTELSMNCRIQKSGTIRLASGCVTQKYELFIFLGFVHQKPCLYFLFLYNCLYYYVFLFFF